MHQWIFVYHNQHGRPRWREEKKTEQNLFVRRVKFEAKVHVTNNRRLRSMYCTIEANYWRTRSITQPLCDSRATCSQRHCDLTIFKMAYVHHLRFVMTLQYCIAGHTFVVQILSWNFMSIGFVVSEILAISYVGLMAVHNGSWQLWGCACAVLRNP